MTVKEMIELLSKLDETIEVVTEDEEMLVVDIKYIQPICEYDLYEHKNQLKWYCIKNK